MLATYYILAIFLGVMIGASIVGIINHRYDEKEREIDEIRHEAICSMISSLEMSMLSLKCRYDEIFSGMDKEVSASEKEFIRRSRVLYALIGDEMKAGEISE